MVKLSLLGLFFQSSLTRDEFDNLPSIACQESIDGTGDVKVSHLDRSRCRLNVEAHIHNHLELFLCGVAGWLLDRWPLHSRNRLVVPLLSSTKETSSNVVALRSTSSTLSKVASTVLVDKVLLQHGAVYEVAGCLLEECDQNRVIAHVAQL